MSRDYHSIIARAVSRSPDATDEARQAIYDQARTALHERLGNVPQISDTQLVNEHHRLEVAIYEVDEGLLLSVGIEDADLANRCRAFREPA